MLLEGSIGGGLFVLLLSGYKILSLRISSKVDREWCEKIEHITCSRMAKGDEKFEKIMDVLQKQAVEIGIIITEIKNTNKKIDQLVKGGPA